MNGYIPDLYEKAKSVVTMSKLLDHYNVPIRGGPQLYLRCILPNHGSPSKKNSLNVNLDRNIWSCWADECRASREGKNISGNVLGFVMAMEGCDLKSAATKIVEWYGTKEVSSNGKTSVSKTENAGPIPAASAPEHNLVDWLEQKTPVVESNSNNPGVGADNPSPLDTNPSAGNGKRYMEEVDQWFFTLCELRQGESFGAEAYWKRVKNVIKGRLIDSYNAGKAARST
jgi:hypothetical protein